MLGIKNKIKELLIKEEEDLLNSSCEQSNFKENISKESTLEFFEQSQEETNQKVISILSFKHKRRLKEIKNAYMRLEDPSFGICLDCEEKIEEKRLLANPCACLCRDCQEIKENESHQFKKVA